MKRFFAVVGFSFVFSLLLMNYVVSSSTFFICSLALTAMLSLLFKRTRESMEIPAFLLSMLLASVMFTINSAEVNESVSKHNNIRADITATVLEPHSFSSSGNYSYLVRVNTIGNEEVSFKMRLYVPYDICAEPYDTVEFSCKPFVLGENNESQYLYYRSKGAVLGGYTNGVEIHNAEKRPLLYYIYSFRLKSEKILRKLLPAQNSEISISLLFGDKTYLPKGIKESFKRAGLSHVMAVSGLHISIWIMGLFTVLKKFKLNHKLSVLYTLLFGFVFMCLCSFSTGVVRGYLMLLLFLTAELFDRKSDSFNSLGFAAFVICLINPFCVCDTSFLLSFFSAFGVLVYGKIQPEKIKVNSSDKIKTRIMKYGASSVLLSIAVTLFVLPVTLSMFGSLSIYTALSNLLALFAVSPIMILSGLLILLPSFAPFCSIISAVVSFLEGYMVLVSQFTSALPYSYIESENRLVTVLLPCLVISAILLIYIKKSKEKDIMPFAVAFSSVTVVLAHGFLLK